MSEEPTKDSVRLNVSVDRKTHTELLKIGADRGQKLTVLVPSLLREAVARIQTDQRTPGGASLTTDGSS